MLTFWSRWQAWQSARRTTHRGRAYAARSLALIGAVVAKDLATVERLLAQGADPNGRYGQRPLVLAVLDTFQNPADWDDARPGALGNAMLDALLDAGADPNAHSPAPSPYVVEDLSEPWVRAGLFNHDHPLHQAVSDGFVGAVVRLLRHGSNPQAWARIQGEELGQVLHQARDATMVQALLDGGSDVLAVSEWNETALMRARRALPNDPVLHALLERAEMRTVMARDEHDDRNVPRPPLQTRSRL